MNHGDDTVIPYEEAVRRHRALEEQKRKGVIREVKISDAMNHLLEKQAEPEEEGPSPAHLRDIVAREFSEEDERSNDEPEEQSGDGVDAPFCRLDRRPAGDEDGAPASSGRPEDSPRR